MNQYGDFGKETEELMTICERNDRIPPELFKEFGVKRGLRDVDGTGVLAGISNISRIDAFKTEDGKKVPCDGQLWYRGYNVIDLIHGFEGKRFGFEEVAYLLLFGELPDARPARQPAGASRHGGGGVRYDSPAQVQQELRDAGR